MKVRERGKRNIDKYMKSVIKVSGKNIQIKNDNFRYLNITQEPFTLTKGSKVELNLGSNSFIPGFEENYENMRFSLWQS